MPDLKTAHRNIEIADIVKAGRKPQNNLKS